MSIEQNWKRLNEQEDNDLSQLLQPGRLKRLHSSNPLQKIKFNLLMNIIGAVLIAGFYVYVLIRFPQWPVLLCIGMVMLFTLWAGYTSWLQYKSIDTFATGYSLLAQMEKQYAAINAWMKTQLRVAIFVYPVAAAGGFMIGGMAGSGKSIAFFMGKPVVLAALIITVLILVPVCMWLAKWMFKKSFGKHLATLKGNIDALKTGY